MNGQNAVVCKWETGSSWSPCDGTVYSLNGESVRGEGRVTWPEWSRDNTWKSLQSLMPWNRQTPAKARSVATQHHRERCHG